LFHENVKPCKYWDTQAFFMQKISPNSLFIVHINIRSLQKNIDSLYELVLQMWRPPDIISVIETRLKSDPKTNINIKGFDFLMLILQQMQEV